MDKHMDVSNSAAVLSSNAGDDKAWARAEIRVRRVPAVWSKPAKVQVLSVTLAEDLDGAGEPAEIYFGTQSEVGKRYTAHKGRPVQIEQPKLPGVNAEPYRPIPTTYFEASLWDEDPGANQFVGVVSMNLYHGDFWTNVGRTVVSKDGGYVAKYYKQGRFYVGDFVVENPGYHLEELRFRAYVPIWDR